MNVPLWVWLVTIVGFVLVIGADLWLNDHKPHAVTLGEVTRWVVFYVALAVAFGCGVWFFSGGTYAGEFFAGYLTSTRCRSTTCSCSSSSCPRSRSRSSTSTGCCWSAS